MDTIIKELLIKICDLLCDYDKLNFLSASNCLCAIKQYVFFDDAVDIQTIADLPYFDRFTNVTVDTFVKKLPKCLVKITLVSQNANVLGALPRTVRHLVLTCHCKPHLLNNISNTITHLDIYMVIERHMQKRIPTSVTHLHIEHFDDDVYLEGCIPQSVIHLTFGYGDKPNITTGCIPRSVRYLEFMGSVYHDIKLPHGLTHAIFNNTLRENIDIPNTVTHLTIRGEANPLLNIPNSVMHLYLGGTCATIRIPDSVTHLDLLHKNMNVPNSVISLVYMGKILDDGNWIPSSVKYIEFTQAYHRKYVPPSATHLTLPAYRSEYALRKIPMHIEHVVYRGYNIDWDDVSIDNIPPHIKSLRIGHFDVNL